MNHVYVVNNHNIVERFETNDDISKIISIIGSPINLELLTHLFETKKITSFRSDFARKYYDDILQLKAPPNLALLKIGTRLLQQGLRIYL